MLHVRLVVPAERTDALADAVAAAAGVINVVVLPGAARHPIGDVVLVDVVDEAANALLDVLELHDVARHGTVSIEQADVVMGLRARDAEHLVPGEGADAVVWAQVLDRVRRESRLTWTYVVFMVIATSLAAAGILNDSTVLIVGAMVVGPDFLPLAGISLGLAERRPALARDGLRTLVVGFVVAMAAAAALTLVADAAGWIPEGYDVTARGDTAFISRPDEWAVIVAALAGVAGTLSLSARREGALVGVLISVTTIPAAADAAVALALGELGEAGRASVQLLVNLTVLALVGALTLVVQHRIDGGRGTRSR